MSPSARFVGRIPVNNLWLLMLYASDLSRFRGPFSAMVDSDIDDLPDLVARLLATAVDRRLRRSLTRGYQHREAGLRRVRGRIDLLRTEAGLLLDRGEVFCRFEELTANTPRNRLIRVALELLGRLVQDAGLVNQCRALAVSLARAGVVGGRPSRAEMAKDQIGRNESEDSLMAALAELAFALALPTEDSGTVALVAPDREEVWVRRLFEKAVLGFAQVELEPLGWRIQGGLRLWWQIDSASGGLLSILPNMQTDVVLDEPGGARRTILDTKFTSILAQDRFSQDRLKSNYLYQMYAYIRSQEGRPGCPPSVGGLFVHPALNAEVKEKVVIQGHPIAFATVDLARPAKEIRAELRSILRIW